LPDIIKKKKVLVKNERRYEERSSLVRSKKDKLANLAKQANLVKKGEGVKVMKAIMEIIRAKAIT
jgi:hypothetical protein